MYCFFNSTSLYRHCFQQIKALAAFVGIPVMQELKGSRGEKNKKDSTMTIFFIF